MSYYMRQCRLERKDEGRNVSTMTWIPEEFAVLNKVLKLKDNGEWTNGWKVTTVSSSRIKVEEAVKASSAHKRQRKASDRLRSSKRENE